MKVSIIGAGTDLGVHLDGARYGSNQLINDIKNSFEVDISNLVQDNNIIKSRNLSDKRKNEYEINKFNEKIFNIITDKIKNGFFPITIGGDHSSSIASVMADSSFSKEDGIGLIWIDSSSCFSSYETTVTGNIKDVSCNAVTGYKCDELIKFCLDKTIDPRKVVIIGARNISKPEKDNIKYSGVTVFTISDIEEKGINNVMDEAFKIAGDNTEGVHVSYDISVIDPELAPGVSVPQVDGISKEDAMTILTKTLENIDIVRAYDVVGLDPLRDEDRKTEQIALDILASVIKKVENDKGNKKTIKRY